MASITNRGNNSYQIRIYNKRSKKTENITYHADPDLTPAKQLKAANAEAIRLENTTQNGHYGRNKMRFGDYVDRWLSIVVQSISGSTYDSYEQRILNAKKYFADMKLTDIHTRDINDYISFLENADSKTTYYYINDNIDMHSKILKLGPTRKAQYNSLGVSKATLDTILSGSRFSKETSDKLISFYGSSIVKADISTKKLSMMTIKHYIETLSSFFTFAVDEEMISSNPCLNARKPKVPKYHAETTVDQAQVLQVLSQLILEPKESKNMIVAVSIAILTGMRRSEIMGLTWDCVDFDRSLLSIEKARIKTKHGIITKSTKNTSSYRVIKIPTELTELLAEYKDCQNDQCTKLGSKWNDSGYVIVDAFGLPLNPNTLTQWYGKFWRRQGLPHTSIKEFRTACGSILASNGQICSDISNLLGHARKSTTLDIYIKAFATAASINTTAMGDIILGKAKK